MGPQRPDIHSRVRNHEEQLVLGILSNVYFGCGQPWVNNIQAGWRGGLRFSQIWFLRDSRRVTDHWSGKVSINRADLLGLGGG